MKPKLISEAMMAAKDEIEKAEKDHESYLNQMINRPTSFEEAEIASYIISKKRGKNEKIER